jgi:N6-L-threonylcarbamoyladenine synthase
LNLKKLLPVKEGERGLRQSDALFAHTKNLPEIMDGVGAFLDANYPSRKIVAVGYSATPRDVEGSYMPCFLSGAATASAISATVGCKSYAFSHQSGHVTAALYSAGRLDLLDGGQAFAAFHVSGGTTELLLVTPNKGGFSIELIGGTADMNAGQAIYRTGVLMGLNFPCGREMESLIGEREIAPVKTKISVKGLECNLSGLENLAAKLYRETDDKALVSAYCFDFIADTLCRLTENLRDKYENIPIIYAGGVMSNKRIGARLAKYEKTYFSAPEFSSDNAAGVALLCRRKYFEEH